MLERPFWHAGAFSLSASQTAYDQRILIDPRADFYMRAMGMFNASGAIAGRLRRADGAFFTGPDFFHLSGFMNTGGFWRPKPIFPQLRYPGNGAFVFDLRDLGGAGDATIYPVLYGVQRFEDDALPRTQLPAAYTEHDYTITLRQTISGAGTQILEIPLRCDTGDAFIVRSMTWKFIGNEPFTMHIRIWDQHTHMFMNTWCPLRLLFAGPALATDQPVPATPFPEMVIPPDGRFTIDLWNRTEAGPFTVELNFTGVRLVGVQP